MNWVFNVELSYQKAKKIDTVSKIIMMTRVYLDVKLLHVWGRTPIIVATKRTIKSANCIIFNAISCERSF